MRKTELDLTSLEERRDRLLYIIISSISKITNVDKLTMFEDKTSRPRGHGWELETDESQGRQKELLQC